MPLLDEAGATATAPRRSQRGPAGQHHHTPHATAGTVARTSPVAQA